MENKYKNIVDYIKEMLKTRQLKSGSRITSIRKIAALFKCSKSTVIRAFDELQKENVLFLIPKSGYYIVEKEDFHKKDRELTGYLSICSDKEINYEESGDSIIDFSAVCPNPGLLPYREFHQCINQAVRIYKDSLFSYSMQDKQRKNQRWNQYHF